MRINGCTQYSSLRDRFLAQIEPITESGCWIWVGNANSCGYGLIKDHYKSRTTHRVAYELFIAPIPEGMCVCHKCDVRCCVNPTHLFLGTYKENNRDMVYKGRARYPGHLGLKGSDHPLAKVSEADVINIRRSAEPTSVLAKQYGMTWQGISLIKKRKSCGHVP